MANNTIYPFGPGGQTPVTIPIADDLNTSRADMALSAKQGVVLRGVIGEGFFYNFSDIDLSELTEQLCTLTTSNKWYVSGNNGRHKAIPLTQGKLYRLAFISSSGHGFWGLVTSSYSPPYANNSTVPFVSVQTARYQMEPETEVTFSPTSDAAYLIICTVDGAGLSLDWEVSEADGSSNLGTVEEQVRVIPQLSEKVQNLLDYVDIPPYDIGEEIDLTGYSASVCSLGTASVGWYRNGSSGPQRHIAIPVTPGNTYRLNAMRSSGSGSGTAGFFGWVTSSYSPPYSNGDAIPYVTGTSRMNSPTGENTYVEVPENAAYLILTTVDGSGTVFSWRMWETQEHSDEKTLEDRLEGLEQSSGSRTFRYAHWNIGHFTYYDNRQGDSTPDITAANFDTMIARYKNALNEINSDVLCVCEDDPLFDAVGDLSLDVLYYKYGIKYQGTKYNYMCASIYANLPLTVTSVSEITYPQTVQANRYYKLMVATLNGKTIKIVETHLDWNQGDNGAAYRAAQIQKLISDFANDPFVIISADFNVEDTTEYEAFASAGYNMANHGYLDDLVTYHGHTSPYNQKPLDNILAKGFRINNIKVHEGTFDLSDHAAISCDLTMIL